MTQIQIRIDEKTKNSAKQVLDKLGLDMTSAITIYLKQIVTHNGIPFPLVTENGLTPKQESTILQASADAKLGKNITKPMATPEAIDYLKSL